MKSLTLSTDDHAQLLEMFRDFKSDSEALLMNHQRMCKIPNCVVEQIVAESIKKSSHLLSIIESAQTVN